MESSSLFCYKDVHVGIRLVYKKKKEVSNLHGEDSQEGKCKDFSLALAFGLGMSEDTHLLLGLCPKSKVSWMLLIFSDRTGFPIMTCEPLLVKRMIELRLNLHILALPEPGTREQ